MKQGCIIALLAVLMAVASLTVAAAQQAERATLVKGTVFWDKNGNRVKEAREPGLKRVCVSNGKEVVQTNSKGQYQLPAYDDMAVFVVKPSGWMTPLNEQNVPLFSYVHKPAGSPKELKKYRGLEPTGPLPAAVDFPLYKVREPKNFKAIVTGDTQVRNDREIDYLRNSLVEEVQGSDALFCIVMGDNVYDDLRLYPRYLEVMGAMGMPVYYAPGNHDMNLDAPSTNDSLDTFKRHLGAAYYSFNYGKVHFVVLNSVEYPAADPNMSYAGNIDPVQMEWLANDLKYTPMDFLVVLNMHIPLITDVNRSSITHQVNNREELYQLLEGRSAVSLAGHTHSIAHFSPGDKLDGWGQPTPIPQIIVGAACGSWWSGELDDDGVPYSYMSCGSPRGHFIFEFNKNEYREAYQAHGKPAGKQLHLSFLTEQFKSWYANIASDAPTLTAADLADRDRLLATELETSLLVANVWNASRNAQVTCQFNDRAPQTAQWKMNTVDPFALLQQYNLSKSYWASENRSTHLWTCPVPVDLAPGAHQVTVRAKLDNGFEFEETKVFEVVKAKQ